MALDKLVDSTQLDSDLTSVANAIRAKGGTSAQLAFPAGFVSAIGDIPSGGGLTMESVMVKTWPSGAVSTSFSGAILGGQFYDRDSITSFSAPNVTEIGEKAFYSCGELVSFSFPSVTLVKAQAFDYCSKLVDMFLPKATINGEQRSFASVLKYIVCNVMSGDVTYQFSKNGALIAVDAVSGKLNNSHFNNCYNLDTIVLRGDALVTMTATNALTQNTCFKSGGYNGKHGTLYVPQSMISSYQAASNWSTILGYTGNQIKSIESTHTDPDAPIDLTLYYVDGTLIPTP